MKPFILTAALMLSASAAWADEAGDCAANAGSYLTGIVTTAPYFKSGKTQKGVELSHTHVTVTGDQDGQSYDVAMDNVFAAGYDDAGEHVPAPLSKIVKGQRLGLCGQLYSGGGGIHWVHTNCGAAPTSAKPNGWVKEIDASGKPTTGNMEDSIQYCKLWP